jgi:uncharacterized BrkB/YihY/UPF0761 family membrane protein
MIAWGLAPTRMRRPLHASAAFAGLAIAGLGASIFASWGRHHFGGFGLVVTTADVVVYTLIALLAFTHLPRPEQVGRHELWPGALLVGWGLTAVHLFLAYYLAGRLESSPGLYGALGASTVVLLVLFLIARLVLSAMFLNATLYRTGQADGA